MKALSKSQQTILDYLKNCSHEDIDGASSLEGS